MTGTSGGFAQYLEKGFTHRSTYRALRAKNQNKFVGKICWTDNFIP